MMRPADRGGDETVFHENTKNTLKHEEDEQLLCREAGRGRFLKLMCEGLWNLMKTFH